VAAEEQYLPPLRKRIVQEYGCDSDWENESIYAHQVGLDEERPGELPGGRPIEKKLTL
jgi:hypothetical protein